MGRDDREGGDRVGRGRDAEGEDGDGLSASRPVDEDAPAHGHGSRVAGVGEALPVQVHEPRGRRRTAPWRGGRSSPCLSSRRGTPSGGLEALGRGGGGRGRRLPALFFSKRRMPRGPIGRRSNPRARTHSNTFPLRYGSCDPLALHTSLTWTLGILSGPDWRINSMPSVGPDRPRAVRTMGMELAAM